MLLYVLLPAMDTVVDRIAAAIGDYTFVVILLWLAIGLSGVIPVILWAHRVWLQHREGEARATREEVTPTPARGFAGQLALVLILGWLPSVALLTVDESLAAACLIALPPAAAVLGAAAAVRGERLGVIALVLADGVLLGIPAYLSYQFQSLNLNGVLF